MKQSIRISHRRYPHNFFTDMTRKKLPETLTIDGKLFYIFDEYSNEANATMCADLARRANLFTEVTVVRRSPRYLLCVHGVNHDRVNKTPDELMDELQLPKRMPFDEIETASRFVTPRK